MPEQRRSFQRIPFDADTFVSQNQQQWAVELIDLSLNGVLFQQPSEWAIHPGKPLNINIILANDSVINMEVLLVHNTETEVGCRILHIDLDSITLLKHLVALNVGGDEFLERELSALINAHAARA